MQVQDCFFGVFKEIYDSGKGNIHLIDSYASKFAESYDVVSISDDDEIELYIKYLSLCHGRTVLELACGSGRITIPLARKGYKVTGVDISDDMLELLKSKAGKAVRQRIQLFNDDITVLNRIQEKFNLVILPATSIRLLDVDLKTFINHIYNYVEDGGYFIFDFRDLFETDEKIVEGKMVSQTYEKNGEFNVVFIQEQYDSIKMKSKTNFYINSMGETNEVYLGYSDLNLFKYSEVKAILKDTKFSFYEIQKSGEYTGNICDGNIYTCILKK